MACLFTDIADGNSDCSKSKKSSDTPTESVPIFGAVALRFLF